jgi:hypothetical protein
MRIYMDFLLTPFSFSRQMADWIDYLEQYQKMTESFFRSSTERSPKE